ncbi:MAG: hypothetical protein EOM40_16215 [Clostridia bacterium]|nr:hypothetical protein [Clostridia bacterium]NCC43055.1 hypothetical protein [Clostridia bacterium]
MSPSGHVYEEGKRYHKYLELRGNEFWCFDDRLVSAVNIEKIVIKDNIIHESHTYEPIPGKETEFEKVLFVEMKDNRRVK